MDYHQREQGQDFINPFHKIILHKYHPPRLDHALVLVLQFITYGSVGMVFNMILSIDLPLKMVKHG